MTSPTKVPNSMLVSPGGGGASVYGDLTDNATVNLPTVNGPLATALAAETAAIALKQATLVSATNIKTINGASVLGSGDLIVAGVGGQVDATDVSTFASALPFDVTGFGSRVAKKTLDALVTLSVGPGAVEGGSCEIIFVGSGNSGFTVVRPSGWIQRGTDAIDTQIGGHTKFVGEYTDSTVVYVLIPLGKYAVSDTTPPTLVSATVPDSDPFRINLVWSEAINSTLSAAPFAVNAGHTLTAHTYDTATTSHLTTSTAFVPGETKTLAYVVPGANKVQDLAGNLLVAFSGFAITDSVTAPTLLTAAVANATPTHIDLTWSEAINSTLADFSAFAVSAGHTLTAHTYVDATHSYLTTSAAFVAAETRTLAYVVPGSNPMKDAGGTLAAAFSGFSISDNVSGARITFTDTFTGADGSAPNARWTPDTAGWEIHSNHLRFIGASYSWIKADYTAGDNTVSVDIDFSALTNHFGGIVIRYVDDNNYVSVIARGDNSEILRIISVVAGVVTQTLDDPGAVDRTTSGTNLTVGVVGNLITATVTGGSNPGAFSGTFTAHSTATKFALAMNTAKPDNIFDNCVLS